MAIDETQRAKEILAALSESSLDDPAVAGVLRAWPRVTDDLCRMLDAERTSIIAALRGASIGSAAEAIAVVEQLGGYGSAK